MKTNRFATCAALIALAMAPLAAIAQSAAPAPATVTVTGEGKIEVAPDMATLTMGVTSRGESAAEALTANSADMAKILAALTEAGVATRDVQTSSINLNPVWDSEGYGKASAITGYEVSNQVTVSIRDLPALGKVMDGLVAVGVNQLYGLNFGLTEPEPQIDAARKASVADARRKAELLAEAAGLKLGAITSITEGGAGHGGPVAMFARDSAASGVPVAEGALTMTASVTVSWTLVAE